MPVILLPFVSVGLFAIECRSSLPPPPLSPLFLPSPPLLSLNHSFTLGPNYETASNKYMYFFFLLRGREKKPCLHFFYDSRLNSRLKEVLFSESSSADRVGRRDGIFPGCSNCVSLIRTVMLDS